MHAKPDLRVVLEWKIADSGSVIADVILRSDLAPTFSEKLAWPVMKIYGFDSVQQLLQQDGYLFKLLANDSGVVLFPHATEHCDATQPGIKYLDESRGNALAAMVKPSRIEFRQHDNFSDERVKMLWDRILQIPEMAFAADSTITYQGRVL